jgi:hypothetical protein
MEDLGGWTQPLQTQDLMSTPWYGGATALGNILNQVMGARRLAVLGEARAQVRRSFSLEIYGPAADWIEAYGRYRLLLGT